MIKKYVVTGFHPECIENWPECYSGGYDPRCCRFPKSCSAAIWEEKDLEECDQDGTPTSSGYVLRSAKEQTVDEPNTDVSSSKTTELSPQVTTVPHLVDEAALLANALGDYSQMKSVDPSLHMKIASLSTQNRMQLLTLAGVILGVELSILPANNAICVENSQWLQESKELSGLMEKNDLTLAQWRKTLWDQSRTSFMKRCKERDNK